MHYDRISADSHIDMPWLPPELFTSNTTARLKERMPHVVDGPEMKPSDYWRRQCKATFQFDRIGAKADRRTGRGNADVGIGLPAHRRRVARIVQIHYRTIQPLVRRAGAQNYLRECRQILWADELGFRTPALQAKHTPQRS